MKVEQPSCNWWSSHSVIDVMTSNFTVNSPHLVAEGYYNDATMCTTIFQCFMDLVALCHFSLLLFPASF